MSPVVTLGNKFSRPFFFFQEVDGDQSATFVCGYCGSKGKMLAILV